MIRVRPTGLEREETRAARIDRGYVPVGRHSRAGGGPMLLRLRHEILPQIRNRVLANLAYLRQAVAAASATTLLDVEGGWYATVRVPRTRSEEQWVLALLDERNVLVQPGFFYDFESEAYLVLSLLTEHSIFHKGTDRLLAFVYDSAA